MTPIYDVSYIKSHGMFCITNMKWAKCDLYRASESLCYHSFLLAVTYACIKKSVLEHRVHIGSCSSKKVESDPEPNWNRRNRFHHNPDPTLPGTRKTRKPIKTRSYPEPNPIIPGTGPNHIRFLILLTKIGPGS